MADSLAELVDDLEAEQRALLAEVEGLSADAWLTPTSARGWDVRDTIAHLAHTDELASDTLTGGPRALGPYAAACASPEDVTYQGVLAGRRLNGADVAAWWTRAQTIERDVLRRADPSTRVPWGLGMSLTAFVTARLMETWAHGLDVRAALRIQAHDTDRIRHVAWLSLRALPYAYTVAGRDVPERALRVELVLPSGAPWNFGPEDATDRIAGPAGELCRVFVQRLPARAATGLTVEGDAARSALEVARAFL